MHLAERLWYRWVSGMYGCGSGVMYAVGLRAWSRYVLSARTLTLITEQTALFQVAVDETLIKLKHMTDDLTREQARMDAVLFDVRRMTHKRVEERRVRAERMGMPFTYRKSDVFMWLNEFDEIQKLQELRSCKVKCKRLKARVSNLQKAKFHLQQKLASLENALSNAELVEDFESIMKILEEADNVQMDPLVNQLMSTMMSFADVVADSAARTKELDAEMDDVVTGLSVPDVKMSDDEAQDIIDMIFASADAPPPPAKKVAPPKEEERVVMVVAS